MEEKECRSPYVTSDLLFCFDNAFSLFFFSFFFFLSGVVSILSLSIHIGISSYFILFFPVTLSSLYDTVCPNIVSCFAIREPHVSIYTHVLGIHIALTFSDDVYILMCHAKKKKQKKTGTTEIP